MKKKQTIKWNVEICKILPEPVEFIKHVLNPMLSSGDKGCELIRVQIDRETNTVKIQFANPTNVKLLTKVTFCVEEAMDSWSKMIEATKKLATVASCVITNTYEYAEENKISKRTRKKPISRRCSEA